MRVPILASTSSRRPTLSDRIRRLYLALLYVRAWDPWGYEGSTYEQSKYRNTLDALGQRNFRRALEVGCSVGVFSTMLADRTEELLAIDVASAAVKRARRRLGARKNVKVERAALPEWSPPGKFDLIVCSEVLYYLRREAMLASFRLLESSLAPGGSLIAVHRRGKGRSSPLHGDEVHNLLIKHATTKHVHSETHDGYRLDRFDASNGQRTGCQEP
jgi:trans-aconitate methyltransferase